MDIDFVVCWVDGNDPVWRNKMLAFSKKELSEKNRFRDWGWMKFWFRSVDKFAPWVHKVFFVSDGQVPKWLNVGCDKLVVVDHKDYLSKDLLPTFNTNTIELNFHRIKGLSEHFVAFNDDMFINGPVEKDYYFHNNLPRDITNEQLFLGKGYDNITKWGITVIDFCCTQVIKAHFSRKQVTKDNFYRWYGGYLDMKHRLYALAQIWRDDFQNFSTPHNEKAFLKHIFDEVWNCEHDLLQQSCTRFRETANLSIYLMRYWQLASNKFFPTKLKQKATYQINEDSLDKIIRAIGDENLKSLCLNDPPNITDEFFNLAKDKIYFAFNEKLPNKCQFEI